MNEYCKDVLRHSWGKAPERKALERMYNAKYYAQNKAKWVENKLKRKAKSTYAGVANNISNWLSPNTAGDAYGPRNQTAIEQAYTKSQKKTISAIKTGASFVASVANRLITSFKDDESVIQVTKRFLKRTLKDTLKFFF